MTQYVGIRSEGGLIPYDVLDKIATEESGLGQQPKDFGLSAGRRLTDEIARAWSDAQDYWHIFQRRTASLTESETGTTLTRKWISDLLNEQLLGYELTYQPSGAVIGGKNYPISHRAGAGEESPPVQIEGFRTDLDRRPEGRRLSPQALVQEYLNNSDSHLWGIVSNGFLLRLLRDTSRTSRPSYLEFDLQSILDGNRFSEFALFYRVCHRTRLPRTAEDSTACWLEKYFQLSIEQGGRVRDKLRDGVEDALKTLGTGFLRHPSNEALRERVKSGTLTAAEFHRQLLRLVYRLLFLMVAEERRMIVPESPEADRRQSLFDRYYSVGRLRSLAEKAIEPSTFGDLWIGLQQTFALFEDGDSNPLGIPPLNGDLFSAIAVKDLQGTHLYNNILLGAVGRLSLFEDHRVRQRVNYAALDVEELGSVYESLLDFQPLFTEQPEGMTFELHVGSDRKSTGSYYTRPELVRELIESALVPVMQDRLAGAKESDPVKEKEDKQQAILSMSVCDPACGSGHFLLAAARRMGRELAKIRTGEEEPTPREFHLAVRDVIAHCVYGVDVNPLAVDLCKLALWLEGHWTGKPLTFLDHRIRCGNSLIGVLDMEVLKAGVPDEAFNPITGDDKKVAAGFKKRNREERRGQPRLPFDVVEHVHQYAAESEGFVAIPEDTPGDVHRKKEAYEKARLGKQWWRDWVAANLWTAAFVVPLIKHDDQAVPTYDKLMAYLGGHVDAQLEGRAIGIATEHNFFHWPLEFPSVFEKGGFDAVLGNPPWERLNVKEKEFFASRDPEIAKAPNKAARVRLLQKLPEANPRLWEDYSRAVRRSGSLDKFLRYSTRFPLAACGDINTYAVFAEHARSLLRSTGRAGSILPIGIATDETTAEFFSSLVDGSELVQLLGFENEEFIFPNVHHYFKFCALTIAGAPRRNQPVRFVFFCRDFSQLQDARRSFYLAAGDLKLLSPNTRNCPVFRSTIDAQLTKKIFERIPVFVDEHSNANPWAVNLRRMFHMSDDSEMFRTDTELVSQGATRSAWFIEDEGDRWVPLYEAKLIHQFDHRFATYEGATQANLNAGILPQVPDSRKVDPNASVQPKYWIPASAVEDWQRPRTERWLLGFRAITAAVNERTAIFAILPMTGAANSLLFAQSSARCYQIAALLANFNSLVLDYLLRQKIGGSNLTFHVLRQVPVLSPDQYTNADITFIVPRVVGLTCTAWDVEPFVDDMWREADEVLRQEIEGIWHESHIAAGSENGGVPLSQVRTRESFPHGPFRWNEQHRLSLRADLDGYYAHLYGLTRDELRYILDPKEVFGDDFPSETFRVLKEREEKEYGEYRTQRLVLEAFDKLAESPRFRDEMSKRESAFEVRPTNAATAEVKQASVHQV